MACNAGVVQVEQLRAALAQTRPHSRCHEVGAELGLWVHRQKVDAVNARELHGTEGDTAGAFGVCVQLFFQQRRFTRKAAREDTLAWMKTVDQALHEVQANMREKIQTAAKMIRACRGLMASQKPFVRIQPKPFTAALHITPGQEQIR